MTPRFTRSELPVVAYGWVPVPDLNTSTTDAWEMPCGRIYHATQGRVPRIVTVWQEPDPT